MSPETATMEIDPAIDQKDFGLEYEPVINNYESEAFALPANDNTVDVEPVDPITADLIAYKGGDERDWNLEDRGGGFTFDGTSVRNNETGKAWEGFAEHTIAELATSDFVRLTDFEDDTKLVVTYLIKGPGNTISYEMHSIDKRAMNDTEELGDRAQTDLLERETAAWYDGYEEHEKTPLEVVTLEASVVAAEANIQESVEYTQESVVESIPAAEVAETQEIQTHSFGTIERDRVHTNMLSELLMERLPALDVETKDVFLSITPDISRFNLDMPQQTSEAPQELVEARELAPVLQQHSSRTEKSAHFPEGAIVQISRPVEATPVRTEAPMQFVQRQEVAPVEISREVKAVEPRIEKVEKTEAKEPVAEEKAKPRFRRGREMRFETRAPISHHESEEVREVAHQSVAERAVVRTMERFAPEKKIDREEVVQSDARETPVARIETTQKDAQGQLEQQRRVEETPLQMEAPRVAEHVSHIVDARRVERQEVDAIPIEAIRSERLTEREIDEVLAAHGVTRTSETPVQTISAAEIMRAHAGTPIDAADSANDNAPTPLARRNGIILRTFARRAA